jgi:hypothetical protein
MKAYTGSRRIALLMHDLGIDAGLSVSFPCQFNPAGRMQVPIY